MTGAESDWPIPAALVARMRGEPSTAAWLGGLAATAVALAELWGLHPDGPAWSGWQSVVWPVHTADGPRVLKVGHRAAASSVEAAVLRAWDGRGAVGLHRYDAVRQALLLERVDGDHSLGEHPDADAACEIIGRLLARLHAQADAAVGVASIAEKAERLLTSIDDHRAAGVLPRRAVDQARETLVALRDGPPGRLVHGDAHFENVLADGRGGWTLIDPWPLIGPPEWELLPILRNRWADAAATGDPDAAYRRRVDILCGHVGGDPGWARRIAQAAAVDGLLWRDTPEMFLEPYRVQVAWTG